MYITHETLSQFCNLFKFLVPRAFLQYWSRTSDKVRKNSGNRPSATTKKRNGNTIINKVHTGPILVITYRPHYNKTLKSFISIPMEKQQKRRGEKTPMPNNRIEPKSTTFPAEDPPPNGEKYVSRRKLGYTQNSSFDFNSYWRIAFVIIFVTVT